MSRCDHELFVPGSASFFSCVTSLANPIFIARTTSTERYPVTWGTFVAAMSDPASKPSAQECLKAGEEAVERLVYDMEQHRTPLLVEALLYKQLYARGTRMEGIEGRIQRLAREGR